MIRISFNQPGRADVQLDSEKYMWSVDDDGDLQIMEKANSNKYVALYVKGSWWAVTEIENQPMTTTNIANYITTTHPNITTVPGAATSTYSLGTTSYIIPPKQAL